MSCGSNRFVSLLGILNFGGVGSVGWIEKRFAILRPDQLAGRIDSFFRKGGRVGPHVSDVAVFVKALSRTHGVLGGHAKFAVGFLLHRAGREGGLGPLGVGLHFHADDSKRHFFKPFLQRIRRNSIQLQVVRVLQKARRGIKVFASRNSSFANTNERRGEFLLLGGF